MKGNKSKNTYPQNLLAAAYNIHPADIPEKFGPLPVDFSGTVEYILYTYLTDRERTVLTGLYQNNQSADILAETLRISREDIRTVERTSLKKLTSPTIEKFLKLGIEGVLEERIGEMVEKVSDKSYTDGYGAGYTATASHTIISDIKDVNSDGAGKVPSSLKFCCCSLAVSFFISIVFAVLNFR